ncbi:hypothetical protein HDV03_003193 [Kappamyces sp. JEL0829]|nr:hypothetical protein HDV03_003193 [Kappamyces sp. JEL0829]
MKISIDSRKSSLRHHSLSPTKVDTGFPQQFMPIRFYQLNADFRNLQDFSHVKLRRKDDKIIDAFVKIKETLANNTRVWIWHLDERIRYSCVIGLDHNGSLGEIFGVGESEVVGHPLTELVPSFVQSSARSYACGVCRAGLAFPLALESLENGKLAISCSPQIHGLIITTCEEIILSCGIELAVSLLGMSEADLVGKHIDTVIPTFSNCVSSMEWVDLDTRSLSTDPAARDSKAFLCSPKAFSATAIHRDGTHLPITVHCRSWKDSEQTTLFAVWVSFHKDLQAAGSLNDQLLQCTADPAGRDDSNPFESHRDSFTRDSAPKAKHNPEPGFRPFPKSLESSIGADLTSNDFEIIKDLGEGSYSFIKLAFHKSDPVKVCPGTDAVQTPIVIKYVVRSKILSWCRKPELCDVRIPTELAILKDLAQLQHAHIPSLRSFFFDDFYYGLIMEYNPSIDLFEFIERNSEIDDSVTRHIIKQTLEAVNHIHANGIVHRDIKDENILIDASHHVTLIDFGSSAYISAGPFTTFFGTEIFCPPEVLEGNPYNGMEQDMWAIGSLLYIVVFRQNPFYSVDDILTTPLALPFPVNQHLHALLHLLLDRDPTMRISSTNALLHPWIVSP